MENHMSDLTVVAEDVKNEIENLQQDFTNAMRGLENIGKRLENAYAQVSSLHKQARSEATPNPEVNATTPRVPTSAQLPTPSPTETPKT
jgi:hypothetical protein